MSELRDILPNVSTARSLASFGKNDILNENFSKVIPRLEVMLESYKKEGRVLDADDSEDLPYYKSLLEDTLMPQSLEDLKSVYLVLGIVSEVLYWSGCNNNESATITTINLHNALSYYIRADPDRAIRLRSDIKSSIGNLK